MFSFVVLIVLPVPTLPSACSSSIADNSIASFPLIWSYEEARLGPPLITPGSGAVCIGSNPCRRVTEIPLLTEGTASPQAPTLVLFCETVGLLCFPASVGLRSFPDFISLTHTPISYVSQFAQDCSSLYPLPSISINTIHFHFQKFHGLDG